VLVWAFLVRPFSPTDFSDGLTAKQHPEMTRTNGVPTDTANGNPVEFQQTWPMEVQWTISKQASLLLLLMKKKVNHNRYNNYLIDYTCHGYEL